MISDEKKRVLELFAEGRRFYKLLNFQSALQKFEAAVKIDPNDGPSRVYAERCREFIASPPPDDWDGVYVMKTK